MGLMGRFCPSVLPLPLLQFLLLFFILNTKFHFLSFPFIFYSYFFYIFLLSVQVPPTLPVSFNFSPRYHQTLHLLHLHMEKYDFTYLSIWSVHCSAPSSSAHMTCKMFFTLTGTMWELLCFIFQEKGWMLDRHVYLHIDTMGQLTWLLKWK